uniref:TonB-dependent receptor plug domain-containing protein n=1 Tax=Roseihalotalea indica TaxID=2867963 RepID=A0AA49JKI7_9BACT|nr:TonB-dependent receptor plug domain-containing protein [Tunicatimonas sp. TK19036]
MELRSEQDTEEPIYILSGSGSKKEQPSLSNSLITKDEIAMSGATSLLEVLRLSPELLIRQSTNGNYILHLRGSSSIDRLLDNRNAVLLMINEIPFFDFLDQTVWWEALPVALQDIQHIEIVRFSHSAWYGPEAAEGVINIVTKSDNGSGFRARVNSQAGLYGNYAHQGSISINQNNRFRTRVSAFYNQRSRFQNSYYVFNSQRYVPGDSLLFYQVNAENTNPHFVESLHNSGIHIDANYRWGSSGGLQLSAGTQDSESQGLFRKIDEIALTHRLASTKWLSVRSHWKSVTAYASYQQGLRSYSGYEGYRADNMHQLLGRIEYKYQWKKYRLGLGTEALQYEYKFNELEEQNLEIVPGVQFSLPNEQRYSINFLQQLLLLNERFKATLASRGDYYINAEQLIPSYQLSASYQAHKFHTISAAASYGKRLLTIQEYPSTDSLIHEVKYPKMLAYEAKYQAQITKNVYTGFTAFHYQPNVEADSSEWTNLSQYQRSGLTGEVEWHINRLQVSAFATGIRYYKYRNFVTSHTPPHFSAGLTGRYTALFGKLQAYTSAYYYSTHKFSGEGISYNVPEKIILSGKLSYQVWEEHSIFFSSQNMLDNRRAEYLFGDITGGMYWVGMNLRF